MQCATRAGLVVDPRKTTQHYGWWVFDRVWPQNSAVAVPMGIKGGIRRHHEGCIETKQIHVERVTVRSIFEELLHFAPSGVDRLYVSRVSLWLTH
jgi:hypothetical protein